MKLFINLILIGLLSVSTLSHAEESSYEISHNMSGSASDSFTRVIQKKSTLLCWRGTDELENVNHNTGFSGNTNVGFQAVQSSVYNVANVNWSNVFVNRTFEVDFEITPGILVQSEHEGACTHDHDFKKFTSVSANLDSHLRLNIPRDVYAVRLEVESLKKGLPSGDISFKADKEILSFDKDVSVNYQDKMFKIEKLTKPDVMLSVTPESVLGVDIRWDNQNTKLSFHSKIKITLIGKDACEGVTGALTQGNGNQVLSYLKSISDDLQLTDSIGCFMSASNTKQLLSGFTASQLTSFLTELTKHVLTIKNSPMTTSRFSFQTFLMVQYVTAYAALESITSYCSDKEITELLSTDKKIKTTGFMANYYWLTRTKLALNSMELNRYQAFISGLKTLSQKYPTYWDIKNDKKTLQTVADAMEAIVRISQSRSKTLALGEFPYDSARYMLSQVSVTSLGSQKFKDIDDSLIFLSDMGDKFYGKLAGLRMRLIYGENNPVDVSEMQLSLEKMAATTTSVVGDLDSLREWFNTDSTGAKTLQYVKDINTLSVLVTMIESSSFEKIKLQPLMTNILSRYPLKEMAARTDKCLNP